MTADIPAPDEVTHEKADRFIAARAADLEKAKQGRGEILIAIDAVVKEATDDDAVLRTLVALKVYAQKAKLDELAAEHSARVLAYAFMAERAMQYGWIKDLAHLADVLQVSEPDEDLPEGVLLAAVITNAKNE